MTENEAIVPHHQPFITTNGSSSAFSRGLKIIQEQELRTCVGMRTLIWNRNIFAVEQPGYLSWRYYYRDEDPEETPYEFAVHRFSLTGLHLKSVRFRLLPLRNHHPKTRSRLHFWIYDGRLHVYEELIDDHFVEHVFDLNGELVCIFSDSLTYTKAQDDDGFKVRVIHLESDRDQTAHFQPYGSTSGRFAVVDNDRESGFDEIGLPLIKILLDRSELVSDSPFHVSTYIDENGVARPSYILKAGPARHQNRNWRSFHTAGSSIWTLDSTDSLGQRLTKYNRKGDSIAQSAATWVFREPHLHPLSIVAANDSGCLLTYSGFHFGDNHWYQYIEFDEDETPHLQEVYLTSLLSDYLVKSGPGDPEIGIPIVDSGLILIAIKDDNNYTTLVFEYDIKNGQFDVVEPRFPWAHSLNDGY